MSLKRTGALIRGFLAVLFVLAIGPAIAKKPPDTGPPDKGDDPCQELTEFRPDLVYYLDTGNRKNPKVTFFAVDSNSGCSKALVDFSILLGFVREVSFSSERVDDVYYGRVVWEANRSNPRENPDYVSAIWKFDFTIQGMDVLPAGEPAQVLVNRDHDLSLQVITIDLSPDRRTLIYGYGEFFPWVESSIRMVDVDDCVALDGCSFAPPNGSHVIAQSLDPESVYFTAPAWGPLGRRVYFGEIGPDWDTVYYVDVPEEWDGSTPLERVVLVSSVEDPGLTGNRGLAAGILQDREYLAIVLPAEKTACGYVSFIDVDACEDSCSIEQKFFGTDPSWTREGKIVFNFWPDNAKSCGGNSGTVGLFVDGEVVEFVDGLDPDAAGGLP